MVEAGETRNELVEKNIGLVHSCANKFRGRGVEYDDLFQAGCVGLIKAVDGFDESKGFLFSTYAVPVILGEIKRIFRDGGSVKIGRALKEKARYAMREKENLTNELGQEPTISELAERLGLDIAETAELLNAAMPTISLTADEDNGGGQVDIPVEPPDENISDIIALHEVVATLNEKDKKLIELRYYRGLTQSKTADRLGMSQVQVSRREKVILTLLRKNLTG
ncbi:MAG: sigma-70 family RNA polymerase sigma factor [Clostridiales bacterium]|jgi:RNA polymerase sporulation-specific sigma factor|nr:sigma-70 family RNA polymerase sigma factor [Clostridiales bacterium]